MPPGSLPHLIGQPTQFVPWTLYSQCVDYFGLLNDAGSLYTPLHTSLPGITRRASARLDCISSTRPIVWRASDRESV